MDPFARSPAYEAYHAAPEEPPAEPVGSTYLDTQETSGTEFWNASHRFRHSGWARRRGQVYAALKATQQTSSRIWAFSHCGKHPYLLRSKADPTVHRIAVETCHDRFCLPCAQARSRTIAANVAKKLESGKARFITLTLKHRPCSLEEQTERLYNSFKALRKDPLWRKTQWGGVAFLEVKRSRDGNHWHPHFHVLTTGKFINAAALARVWKHITGDSFIVNVKMCRETVEAVHYCTKYASKPFDPTIFVNQSTLQEAITALVGRRMILTYGKWKGLQVTEKPTDEEWENLGLLERTAHNALRGHEQSLAIIRELFAGNALRYLELVRRNPPPPDWTPTAKPPPTVPTPAVEAQLTFEDWRDCPPDLCF